jgi:deoxyribonuclease V
MSDGGWPESAAGARAPFRLDDEIVGYWVRTRAGVRPVAVHAGWRVGPEAAAHIVLATVAGARTPAPLREARRLARTARARGSENRPENPQNRPTNGPHTPRPEPPRTR